MYVQLIVLSEMQNKEEQICKTQLVSAKPILVLRNLLSKTKSDENH